MRPAVPWLCFGAAGAFLVATLIAVALGGPAWHYTLILSAILLLLAILAFLRLHSEEHARGLQNPPQR